MRFSDSIYGIFLLVANAQQPDHPKILLAGAAEIVDHRLRLTPAVPQVAGAAWLDGKKVLTGGFVLKFRFQMTHQGGLGPGADGLAFVIQNQGVNALAGRGSAGGFALGDGRRDWSIPGIPRSIAVFFDAFQNGDGEDPSDNYVALCTNGQIDSMRWPPRRLAIGRKLPFRLKDGKPHAARIVYKPPMMSLYLDSSEEPNFRVPVDLSTVLNEAGAAFIGFTASTGNGYQNHDILEWSFELTRPKVTSNIAVVHSDIHFLPGDCLPDRNLCTPREAIIEAKGPNRYTIILPAHLPWGASIPNPLGKSVTITGASGLVCFDLSGANLQECSGPQGVEGADASKAFLSPERLPGALLVESTGDGRTRFSVNTRKNKASSKHSQGFFEFEVSLQ